MSKSKRRKRKARQRPQAGGQASSPAPVSQQAESNPSDAPSRWWLIAVCGGLLLAATLWVRSTVPTVEEPEDDGPLVIPAAQAVPRDDPARDGWPSEAFYLAAKKQLGKLAELFAAEELTAKELQPLVDAFEGTSLVPESREVSPLVGGLRRVHGSANPERTFHGASGLADALVRLGREFRGYKKRLEFKMDRVEMDRTLVDTRVRLILTATDGPASRVKQLNTVWQCRWSRDSAKPKLMSIDLDRFELVESGSPAELFADCTASVLDGNACYREQLLVGIDDWMSRLPRALRPVRWGDHGLALGDVNGDGLEDLYLCEPEGLPNRLFLRQPDGRLRDHSAASALDWLDHTRATLLVDLDGDGDRDAAISMRSALLLLSNDGRGHFTVQDSAPVRDAYTLAAADCDGDGDLDLFACGYHADPQTSNEYPLPVPYHNAANGGRNVLLRNDGSWKFHDATAEAGLDQDNFRWSLAAAWEDYDNDGDQDLYVANDFGPNVLYRNDGGKFTDVTDAARVEDVGSGMSVAWGDYDHDGRMDLYVSNMYSTAGGRITSQEHFQAGADAAVRAQFARLAKGNTLFKNLGGPGFEDASLAADVTMGRWAWGAAFADLNNDRWEDLLVANGFVTRIDNHDL